ncbi:MAG: AAA family ATPase [Parcubacteria group bacterium]|nr:AAA family ATPase [Parcubacteria group bacterium]
MKIILFRGRPGTGKTTLSNAFAKYVDFPVLRKDDVYDAAAEFVSEHDIRNKISHGVLYNILETNRKTNCTFILDYAFQYPGDIQIIRKWCNERGVVLKSILVTCSDEKLWAERLKMRAENPAPNQLLTDFESFEKLYGTMQLLPEEDELFVDTINSVGEILTQVIEFISEKDKT